MSSITSQQKDANLSLIIKNKITDNNFALHSPNTAVIIPKL